jgi:hypothetical protein
MVIGWCCYENWVWERWNLTIVISISKQTHTDGFWISIVLKGVLFLNALLFHVQKKIKMHFPLSEEFHKFHMYIWCETCVFLAEVRGKYMHVPRWCNMHVHLVRYEGGTWRMFRCVPTQDAHASSSRMYAEETCKKPHFQLAISPLLDHLLHSNFYNLLKSNWTTLHLIFTAR